MSSYEDRKHKRKLEERKRNEERRQKLKQQLQEQEEQRTRFQAQLGQASPVSSTTSTTFSNALLLGLRNTSPAVSKTSDSNIAEEVEAKVATKNQEDKNINHDESLKLSYAKKSRYLVHNTLSERETCHDQSSSTNSWLTSETNNHAKSCRIATTTTAAATVNKNNYNNKVVKTRLTTSSSSSSSDNDGWPAAKSRKNMTAGGAAKNYSTETDVDDKDKEKVGYSSRVQQKVVPTGGGSVATASHPDSDNDDDTTVYRPYAVATGGGLSSDRKNDLPGQSKQSVAYPNEGCGVTNQSTTTTSTHLDSSPMVSCSQQEQTTAAAPPVSVPETAAAERKSESKVSFHVKRKRRRLRSDSSSSSSSSGSDFDIVELAIRREQAMMAQAQGRSLPENKRGSKNGSSSEHDNDHTHDDGSNYDSTWGKNKNSVIHNKARVNPIKNEFDSDEPSSRRSKDTRQKQSASTKSEVNSVEHVPSEKDSLHVSRRAEVSASSILDATLADNDENDPRRCRKEELPSAPRNPISREKEERERNDAQHGVASPQVCHSVASSSAWDEALWADPEIDSDAPKLKRGGRKKKSKKEEPEEGNDDNNDTKVNTNIGRDNDGEDAKKNKKKKAPFAKRADNVLSTMSPPSSPSEAKYVGRSSVVGLKELMNEEEDESDFERKPKPDFSDPKFGPFGDEPLFLGMDQAGYEREVPVSMARYLPPYQRDGVIFVFKAITERKGAILGDDMGLGKTIQTVSLVAALLGKNGTGQDVLEIRSRVKKVDERQRRKQKALEEFCRLGQITTNPMEDDESVNLSAWAPILIMAPSSVKINWIRDFGTWSHVTIAVYDSNDDHAGVEAVKEGLAEVLIVTHDKFAMDSHFEKLLKVPWKLVVIDEFHKFKNEKGRKSECIKELRDQQGCCILGLTGTVFQNNHAELWNLVDIVADGFLGPWKVFDHDVAKPLKLSRAKDATDDAIELGRRKKEELSAKLQTIYLRRTKEITLKDELPRKDERVVFCEPSPIQKAIYKHILKQPDFILVSEAHLPCRCGVNDEFFKNMHALPTREEKVDYFRRNKKTVQTRSECCYKFPRLSPNSDEIDPRAVVWRTLNQHPNEEQCDRCPFCLIFPALQILHKVSTHVALIQPEQSPESVHLGKKFKIEKELEIARAFIPQEIIPMLPGGSLIRRRNMMNDHFGLSGKMKILARLLQKISRLDGRVLVFSGSTTTLDLIEDFAMTTGYTYLRMDGSTPTKKRTELADEFKTNKNVFLFLLSTKAMGLGLNLTSASWVIIFDVEWNPTYDAQAQDRSYRIGQSKDVKVFRLVCRGTIEEMKYLRQVYKTQLKSETIAEPGSDRDNKRLFRGVAGDDNRRGEIFGLANLTRFEEDGTFMNYGEQANEAAQFKSNIYNMESFLSAAKTMVDDGNHREELDVLGVAAEDSQSEAHNEKIDPNSLVKAASFFQGEHVSDIIDVQQSQMLGGDSQACLQICDEIPKIETVTHLSEDKMQEAPSLLQKQASLSSKGFAKETGRKSQMQRPASISASKKAPAERSVKSVLGYSSTTFSASDLALPGSITKKKKGDSTHRSSYKLSFKKQE